LKDKTVLDVRLLVDRSIGEVFVMDGRAVFSKTAGPQITSESHVVVEVAVGGAMPAAMVQSAEV